MPFHYEWYNDEKTAMRYVAEGVWDWKDYHTCVRASLFSLHGIEHSVDSIIDFTGSTREALPSGFVAHARTFGKKQSVTLSGRAVVIGLPDKAYTLLDVKESKQLATSDGVIRFVSTEADIHPILEQWRTDSA